MERRFDLRIAADREALASYLPTFDARTFAFSAEVFVQGLAYVSKFLREPSWMTYQWGILGPLRGGKVFHHISLERIVVLGHELNELSSHAGFSSLLRGFENPAQFHDSLFETQVASIFSRLTATMKLIFAPKHNVRGRIKCPEFDVETIVGPLSIECKQRHPNTHHSSERISAVGEAIATAMDAAEWPDHLRLEVDLKGPIREELSSFATALVQTASQLSSVNNATIRTSAINAYVVARKAPFVITSIQAGYDRMMSRSGMATGLFNPEVTPLRVASSNLDKKIAKAVGVQINNALAQLPEDRQGIIMLGDVPTRIAVEAINRRIDKPAYDNILAFGIIEDDQLHYMFREERRSVLDRLMNSGIRPLFAAA